MATATRWIPVGELAAGFRAESYAPAPSAELAGERLRVALEYGPNVELVFASASALTIHGDAATLERFGGERRYRATSLRPGIYFIDLLPRTAADPTSVTLVLDLKRRHVTVVEGQLPTRAQANASLIERLPAERELTAVEVSFTAGTLGGSQASGRHETTRELIGQRIEYTYSPHEQYEHIYLNERFYTWHCLKGREAGLADTDRCHCCKIDTRLYLFVWREKIVPTLGVTLIDLDAGRTTGKILGYESHACREVTNFPTGAHVRVLNVTARE